MRRTLQKAISDAYEILEKETIQVVAGHLAVTLAGLTVAMKKHRYDALDYNLVGRAASTFAFMAYDFALVKDIEDLFRTNRIDLSKDL